MTRSPETGDPMQDSPDHKPAGRRSFLKAGSAILAGGAALSVPLACGLATFLSPLSAVPDGAGWVRIAPITALPEDGTPRRFQAIASRRNAWNRFPESPVGTLFLRRIGPQSVEAFSATCPHAGCIVEFVPGRKAFLCPCHDSLFALDGRVLNPASPSPRPLDRLEVEVRDGRDVWVLFQVFLPGTKERTPA
jgi:Rieske Fe-S protein